MTVKYIAQCPISLSGHPHLIAKGEALPEKVPTKIIDDLLAEKAIVESSEKPAGSAAPSEKVGK